MTETPMTYSVDDITATAAADQDMALATHTAEAIVAHFGVLLAGGIAYEDAVRFAGKFGDLLLDSYSEVPELTLSLIGEE